ncbi:MAG: HAMP domain-containing histidine kinase [Candidatus Aenigmarchaeota archaeon]|nr:HAMP domain-containing histidine kinase [Candidatus Aenigmarchaeota archaeon]
METVEPGESLWNQQQAISDTLYWELLQANRVYNLGYISYGVVHDLNNLLTIILARIDMAMGVDLDWKEFRHLELARTATLGAAEVVNRLRQSGDIRFDETGGLLDLDSLVLEVAEFFEPHRQEMTEVVGRPVELKVSLGGQGLVKGKATELRTALANIVMNAFDALTSQGGTVTISTEIGGTVRRIVVSDTGIGIPQELLYKIFDPFFTTKGNRGTGLGLTLAREVVERFGGKIEVNSVPGQGSAFTISLPLAQESGCIPK